MIEPLWLVLGLLLPAVVSAVVLWACTVLRVPDWLMRVGWGLSIAVGFSIGYGATFGSPRLGPVESHELILLVLVPAAVVISSLAAIRGVPCWLPWSGRFLLAAGAPALLLQPYLRYEWSGGVAAVWLCGLGLAGVVSWSVLTHMERRSDRCCDQEATSSSWSLPWMGAIVAGGTGVTLMLSASQTLGQLGLTLAAVLAVAGTVGLVLRRSRSTQGCMDVSYPVLIGLWLCGYFYADLAGWHVILLMVAHNIAWIGEWSPIRRLPAWQNVLVRLVGVVVVTAIVVVTAGLKFSQDASPYY